MKKYILASSLVFSLAVMGCGDRSSTEVTNLQIQSNSLEVNDDVIVTTDDKTKVNIIGELGSKLYINGQFYGEFDDSGSMTVELELDHLGSTIYEVKSVTKDGVDSQNITLEIIKKKKNSKLGSVKTKGKAQGLTLSQTGTMFIAEGMSGVELISVGFNDTISSDLLSSIEGVEATSVTLSKDEQTLFIKDNDGKYHKYDISNISEPKEIGIIDHIEKSNLVLSEDDKKRYRVSPCGVVGEDVSDKLDTKRDFLLEDKSIKDIVLVEDDTKLLAAVGKEGLKLISLEEKIPKEIAKKALDGDTSGLSLIKDAGILFVANGESGVEIFNLDILLHEMKK
jgi:uncharacterized protein YjhX (UPF0386 family)